MDKPKRAAERKSPAVNYGIAMHTMIPMRKRPRETSEMVSQLLFGENYAVIMLHDQWLKIITAWDQYTGWIDRKFLREISGSYFAGLQSSRPAVLAARIAELELPDSSKTFITAGSSLPGYDSTSGTLVIGDQKILIRPLAGEITLRSHRIGQTANGFLNSPYLWGGRSLFGFDCSGLVQVVYRIHGLDLPRDAHQQAESGNAINHVQETRTGDLAFFAGDSGKISHVGIITSPGEIIHCSGWVRTDTLDALGIINRQTGILTHRLARLRRLPGLFK